MITQEDRDRAAEALTDWYGARGNRRYDFSKAVKDDHPFTQAFAVHRAAAYAKAIEDAAAYVQANYPHDKRALVPAIRALKDQTQ